MEVHFLLLLGLVRVVQLGDNLESFCNALVELSPLLVGHPLINALPEKGMREPIIIIVVLHLHDLNYIVFVQLFQRIQQPLLVYGVLKRQDLIQSLHVKQIPNRTRHLHYQTLRVVQSVNQRTVHVHCA